MDIQGVEDLKGCLLEKILNRVCLKDAAFESRGYVFGKT